MDDGIELNFAAPSGGAGVIRRKAAPPPPKKGSWVQRLKATKAVKRRAERQTTNGSGIQVAKETESARPNQQQQPKQAAQAPRPAQTSQAPSSRPLHADVDFVRIPNGAGAGQSKGKARASAPVEAPIDVASLAKRSARPQAPLAQQEGGPHSNVASSSRSVPNAAGVGGHQIISSLFSSIPNASLQATDANAEDPDTVVSGAPSNAPSDDSTFIGLGLDPLIAYHLDAKLGIKRPTRIQRSVLRGMLDPTPLSLSPPVDPGDFHVADHLTGNVETRHRDAFIQSQTGSGKTLSYLLPIVQSLLPLASRKGYYVDRSIGTLAIILAPTRELARQISDVLDGLLSLSLSLPQPQTDDEAARHRAVYKRYLVSAVLTGGATRNHEKTRLRRGCPVLVCTPGRLLDHLQNTQSFRCDKLMWLVLDEADRLIEEGFGETLAGIMKALEGRRKIGHEADLALARVGDRPRSHAKPKHVTKFEDDALPDFLKDDSDDDEEEDDGWDYETMGPKPKRANNGVKVEDGDVKPIVAPEHANTTAWPYWSLGRRNVLCSATISGEVQKLAHVALKHPVMYRGSDAAKEDDGADDDEEPELKPIAVVKPSSTAATPAVLENFDLSGVPEEKFTPPSQLDQRYIVVPLKLRLVTLVALMRALIAKANANPDGQGTKIIVFMSCTDSVDYHWKLFGGVQMGATGAPVDSDEAEPVSRSCPLLPSTQIMRLHGSLPLQTRRTSLAAFSSSSTAETHKNSILFCTSVASRGLDMPLVRAVVQYDLPTEQGLNEYVHRVGRTARVGRGGESWAFVSDKEADWVPWVEAGMSSHEAKSTSSSSSSAAANAPGQVKLRQVGVEDVLKRGFGVKSSPGVPAAVAASEYERRATQVQLAFERWVLDDGEHAELARRAFSSWVRAYSTHPMEEKRFFHIKNLHLGHLAKSFGLREAPGKMSASQAQANKANKERERAANGGGGATGGNKTMVRKAAAANVDSDSDSDVDPMDMDLAAATAAADAAAASSKQHHQGSGKKYVPTTDTEKRMTAAVRRQGRLTKMGGKLGEQSSRVAGARMPGTSHRTSHRDMGDGNGASGGGGGGGGGSGEFQVSNSTSELENLVRRVPGQAGQKRKR